MATTKTTAKKAAAKKPAVRKQAKQTKQATEASSIEGLTSRMLAVTDASLGFYGTLFDAMQDGIAELREEAPKQLEAYIERGQKIRKDASQKIKDNDFAPTFDAGEIREQMQSAVEAVKNLLTPAKA